MPRITPLDWKTLSCIFKKAGFTLERENKRHLVLSKEGCLRPVIIPKYKDVGIDIIVSNMRSAKMTRKEFLDLWAQC
ncbi:type II toxin-antitoxin system HicA family toxin [candidate division KSB1 bacterium]